MIDIKTGKEIENPAVLKVPLAGSANASVRRGLGARLAVNFGGESLPYDYEVEWLGSELYKRQYLRTGIYVDENIGKVLTHDVRFMFTSSSSWWQGADYGYFWGYNRNFTTADPWISNSWITGVVTLPAFGNAPMEYDLYQLGQGKNGEHGNNGDYYNYGRNTIYLDGVVVRSYIPCVKDGRPCFYDEVNKTFTYSSSSYDFAAGPRL